MVRYLTRRLGHSLIGLVGIVVVVFVLARLTGKPGALYLPETASGPQIAAFNAAHGYNKPLVVQFFDYVKGVLHFDFGTSLLYAGQSAMNVVLHRYPETLKLAAAALVLSTVVGVTLGALAASHRGSFYDVIARITSMTAAGVPDFWVGIMGILVFSVMLGWLPTSGSGSISYWVLPVVTLSLGPTGVIVQIVRDSMRDELASDYAMVATAKGQSERRVVFIHALRNAAIPAVTIIGTVAASLFNGALIVEVVFGWPGVGSLIVTAAEGRDYSLLQAAVLVTASAIILLNLLVDLTYTRLNPQVRLG